MTPQSRINRCRLIEKIEENPLRAKQLGLENRSTFRSRPIEQPKKQ